MAAMSPRMFAPCVDPSARPKSPCRTSQPKGKPRKSPGRTTASAAITDTPTPSVNTTDGTFSAYRASLATIRQASTPAIRIAQSWTAAGAAGGRVRAHRRLTSVIKLKARRAPIGQSRRMGRPRMTT